MDWTFESISNEIDQYTHDVEKRIPSGDLSAEITSASLRVYLIQEFKKLFDVGIKPDLSNEDEVKIISELSDVGIKTLKQLDAIVPKDFVDVVISCHLDASFLGLLRYIMIISNAEVYFAKAWKESWKYVDRGAFDLLKHYNISEKNLKEYLRKRGTPTTL
jgi:putative GTP pyrophosphokinase